MARDVIVYALVDPVTRQVRYVGRSVNPGARLMGHLSESWWVTEPGSWVSPTQKNWWLRALREEGLCPELIELETASPENACAAEQAWIKGCLEMGDPLLNVNDAFGSPLVAHA